MQSAAELARFHAEVGVMASIYHPNVLRVLATAVDSDEGRFAIVIPHRTERITMQDVVRSFQAAPKLVCAAHATTS